MFVCVYVREREMGEFVCIMVLVCLYTCVRVCAFVGVCVRQIGINY